MLWWDADAFGDLAAYRCNPDYGGSRVPQSVGVLPHCCMMSTAQKTSP